jgi:hypothetical protein
VSRRACCAERSHEQESKVTNENLERNGGRLSVGLAPSAAGCAAATGKTAKRTSTANIAFFIARTFPKRVLYELLGPAFDYNCLARAPQFVWYAPPNNGSTKG